MSGTVRTGDDQAPVAGVAVTLAGQRTTTDAQGHYSLSIDNPGDSGVVQARKNGFLGMAKQAPLQAGTITTQDITLYPVDVQTTFPASQGAVVIANGAVIDIPAGAIRDASGAPFEGTVHIDAGYRSPTTAEGNDAFPQPYAALDGSNEVMLQTVGVIEARLYDDAGQPLQLSQPATLTYPGISVIDQGAASIPLWHYDEERAIWVREGEALRQPDGSYQGEVTHFSQWNLDFAYGPGYSEAHIRGCVNFTNGASSRYGITVTMTGPGYTRMINTQPLDAGEFTLERVPVNTPLTLSFYDAGTGTTQTVPVPAVASGAAAIVDCVTLTGTAAYVSPPPPPLPAPVLADTPSSAFGLREIPIAFWVGEGASDSDRGNATIVTDELGGIRGEDVSFFLSNIGPLSGTLNGQVTTGGYLSFTLTPEAGPSGPMSFTGRIYGDVDNPILQGTWSSVQLDLTVLYGGWDNALPW